MERREYRGRVIEIIEPDPARTRALAAAAPGPELRIDGAPIRWGRLPDGSYFLHEYAFDWQDSLLEVAMRFIDYSERIASSNSPVRGSGGR